MGFYVEIWRRPGHASFGRVIDDPPFREGSFHDGLNLVGDGTLQIPNSFASFDEILLVNRQTLASSKSSLVRLVSDRTDTVVGEWIPNGLAPTSSKNDPYVEVFGQGIKSILTYATTQPYDWDGTANFIPTFPDWIYGGRNILSNEGFEDQGAIPIIYWLLIDATAGTYDIEDGTDTSTIPFDDGDGQVEGALEADIAAINDINVTPLEGVPRGYQLLITATGGTFVIDSPLDTTGNLSAGISAAALETAIEALSDVTNVTVTAVTVDGVGGFQINLHTPATLALSIDTTNLTDGTAQFTVSRTADGFALEFVEPPTGITLTVDDSGLTGSARLQLVQAGELLATNWTKSQQISAGTPREYGTYASWGPSMAQAHSGSWSLRIDPANIAAEIDRYAGAQQIVNTIPGGLYQASIWVYATAPGQEYRLIIRGLDEDDISGVNNGNITPPANVWTQVIVSDITVDRDRVIFRFANTNASGNPAAFFIDDAAFNEGQAVATIGKILGDLYDDATTDHAGRVVWEDEANPGTPYLTLDFSDTLDSNGVAWDRDDLSFKVWQRMDYLQVMQLAEGDFGYESRIVPDDPEAGTWLWQVYNPGGMDTAPDLALLGASSDVTRQLRRFLPRTAHMVEGENRVTARASNSGLVSALGRIETARLGRNLPTLPGIIDAASEDSNDAVISGNPWSYELVDPQDEPGSAYRVGDTITVHDPPEADGTGRLWDWVVTLTSEATTHEVEFLEEA